MSRSLSRRAALAGLVAGLSTSAFANAPLTSLRPQPRPGSVGARSAKAIVAAAQLTGTTAFICTRADGTVIEALGDTILLPPASVAKAVTALYTIDALGRDYRFATVILAAGPIQNGVLEGDLILKGTGDPLLDTDALGGLAAQLRDSGITRITGRFLVDAGDLPYVDQIDPSQLPWVGYNPTISGLNLNFNRVHFEWTRSGSDYSLTMDARARTYQPAVRSSVMRIAESGWPTYTHRMGEGREVWTVARPALGSGGARWLPVRRPDAYAGDVFRTLAGSMGVSLPAPQMESGPIRGNVLASHSSPSSRGLCGGMLKYSTNLTAEVLGLRASQAMGHAPVSLRASAGAMNSWAKDRFGAEMALVDHSGLGDASRVSVADLSKMLTGTADLRGMLKDIPVKDRDGNLVERADHAIRAKTGTLNFVNALAGYITPVGGDVLSFAIISSDLPRRAALRDSDKERPAGARSYARRARIMQQELITRWAKLSMES
ncbi:MAG: D-alanyl-D-alanine carboxypeptidase/D-alanyl-D-alanine-endopeptidase [Pseudomonadota bacterium]